MLYNDLFNMKEITRLHYIYMHMFPNCETYIKMEGKQVDLLLQPIHSVQGNHN